MATTTRQDTAKIYVFPSKPLLSGKGEHRASAPTALRGSHAVQDVEFGSGWYHEAAMRDVDRNRKP